MSSLTLAIKRAAARGYVPIVPYLMTGYPAGVDTAALALAAFDAGAALVELGMPFSDPLADGPTIQRAGQGAIEAGVTVGVCLETAARIAAARKDAPLVLMGYYNPVLAHGLERFCWSAAEAGVHGLILPDLPMEEASTLRSYCEAADLDLILLATPSSPEERLRRIGQQARGFVYAVSRSGVTGAQGALAADLAGFIGRVRRAVTLPIAVGFGIARPEHVARIGALADAAVIGSALIERLETTPAGERGAALRAYVAELASVPLIENPG